MDGKPLAQQFQEDLEAVISKYSGMGMDMGAAIGGLEIVKLNTWLSSVEESDPDGPEAGEDWKPEP